MANFNLIKIIGYMYHLHKRNFQHYNNPIIEPKAEPIINNSIHWVGHATTIINLYNKLIVTDPVLYDLGHIRRLVEPSIQLKHTKIDYVLLTHTHMDHLNYPSLKDINKDALFIVPRGLKLSLNLRGFKNIIVLKPEQTYKDNFIEVKSIQAEHKGNRYPGIGYKDCNSYLITSKDKTVLYSADTAITDAYYGINADIALMPVGCYKPDDFLKMHCSPKQSFEMFKTMNCKMMLPIHYKTFILAQDDDAETIDILENLNDGTINIIDIGQTVPI